VTAPKVSTRDFYKRATIAASVPSNSALPRPAGFTHNLQAPISPLAFILHRCDSHISEARHTQLLQECPAPPQWLLCEGWFHEAATVQGVTVTPMRA
jgi:hypothetical protein